jgi:hypothetical protein
LFERHLHTSSCGGPFGHSAQQLEVHFRPIRNDIPPSHSEILLLLVWMLRRI